jgi:hypothetical protein
VRAGALPHLILDRRRGPVAAIDAARDRELGRRDHDVVDAPMTLGAARGAGARYRDLSARVVLALPGDFRCIARQNLGDAQRALWITSRTSPRHRSRCRPHPVQRADRAGLAAEDSA